MDLYKLLDKKKLRAFRPFDKIYIEPVDYYDNIFLPVKSTNYVDNFLGFKSLLPDFENVKRSSGNIFYNKHYFIDLNNINIEKINNIFYKSEELNG